MILRFTPYEIQSCLFDEKRTNNFLAAINETVCRDDTVVDAGSGSGVLALFAARAGAKKVFSIECNNRFVEVIRNNARINRYDDIIEVMCADASHITLQTQVDVIICELLSTGLFFEPEIQVINNLRRFLKPKGKIIPCECKSWIQMISAQRDFAGLLFDYDSRFTRLDNDIAMSNTTLFDHIDFYKDEPIFVDTAVVSKAIRSGYVNAVRISSRAQLSRNHSVGRSQLLFNPLCIFLKDGPVEVIKNCMYTLNISYTRSEDTLGTKISIKPAYRS